MGRVCWVRPVKARTGHGPSTETRVANGAGRGPTAPSTGYGGGAEARGGPVLKRDAAGGQANREGISAGVYSPDAARSARCTSVLGRLSRDRNGGHPPDVHLAVRGFARRVDRIVGWDLTTRSAYTRAQPVRDPRYRARRRRVIRCGLPDCDRCTSRGEKTV